MGVGWAFMVARRLSPENVGTPLNGPYHPNDGQFDCDLC